MPQFDNSDPLAALDFDEPDAPGRPGVAERDALDFSAGDDDFYEAPADDALDAQAPAAVDDTGTELDAIDSQIAASDDESSEDENGLQLYTDSNPAETVSVSALIDGRTQRIDRSGKADGLTESDLADEVIAVGDLARRRGLVGQRSYLLDTVDTSGAVSELGDLFGVDGGEALRNLLDLDMGLPTPEQAEAVQAEVFAERYADS